MKSRFLSGHDLILLVYPESEMAFSGKTELKAGLKVRLQDRQKQLESLFLKAGLLK